MKIPVVRAALPIFVALAALLPQSSLAAEADGANTAWILTSTALVLFMTLPGLALFYGGLVRSKNILSVLMQCFSITCVASLLWFAVAYSMAFSDGNDFVGGLSPAASVDTLRLDVGYQFQQLEERDFELTTTRAGYTNPYEVVTADGEAHVLTGSITLKF